jgi:RNA polymerase sigma-70 factor (ECF subfamily)
VHATDQVPYPLKQAICITQAKNIVIGMALLGVMDAPIICPKMPEHEHGRLLTDESLVHNIAHGCDNCFDLLFLRFFRPVFSIACKILRDRSEAEDVVQEVFLAIHEQRERFDPARGSARTWVLQFCYYKSMKRRTYLSKRHFYAASVSADGDGCDSLLVQQEFIQRSVECKEIIEQGLACLNPAQRRVVELLHFGGHTLREISQMEGKELGAIRNSYYRGLKALKASLGEGVSRAPTSAKRQEEYEIEL